MGDWSTLMTLSKNSSPLISAKGAGSALLPYRCCATALYSVSLISVDLPEPDTPVMLDQQADRQIERDFFQVVAAGTVDLQHALGIGLRYFLGAGMLRRPAR